MAIIKFRFDDFFVSQRVHFLKNESRISFKKYSKRRHTELNQIKILYLSRVCGRYLPRIPSRQSTSEKSKSLIIFLHSRLMANVCGCVDNVLYGKADVCGPEEIQATNCVDNLKENFDPSRDCYCPNICDGVNYEIVTSRLEWPTKRSIPQFTASVYSALSRDYLF